LQCALFSGKGKRKPIRVFHKAVQTKEMESPKLYLNSFEYGLELEAFYFF
jgi:hypothetical protein